jgi:hypothetical protein
MSDERIRVLATFESQEALLAGMRRAVSWIKVSEADAIIALASKERLMDVLCPDEYSAREIELAVEVVRYYAQVVLGQEKSPPAEAGGQGG